MAATPVGAGTDSSHRAPAMVTCRRSPRPGSPPSPPRPGGCGPGGRASSPPTAATATSPSQIGPAPVEQPGERHGRDRPGEVPRQLDEREVAAAQVLRRRLGRERAVHRAAEHLAGGVDDRSDEDDDGGQHHRQPAGPQHDQEGRGEDRVGQQQHPPPDRTRHRAHHQALPEADHHGVDGEDRAGDPAGQAQHGGGVDGHREVQRHHRGREGQLRRPEQAVGPVPQHHAPGSLGAAVLAPAASAARRGAARRPGRTTRRWPPRRRSTPSVVPIVMARPESRPPRANPTLRSAPRKPNHFSRSPGTEIAATMLP